MLGQALAVVGTGFVSSVGLCSATACAAIRAGVTNLSQTRFLDSSGDFIMANVVPTNDSTLGLPKLKRMATCAITECLSDIPKSSWNRIPLLLCVAERNRPGRLEGLEQDLFAEIERGLEANFSSESLIIPYGRTSGAVALSKARNLLQTTTAPCVVIAAADSLLAWPTLGEYEEAGRLLCGDNSNGFIPGEGAAAIAVAPPNSHRRLLCKGIGFGTEAATIDSELPLRADGLSAAIVEALADSSTMMSEVALRIADISGEQYYFKEAALALARTLKTRKDEFDLWHPAECIGETGAAIGLAMIIIAEAAFRKGYAPKGKILLHTSADDGHRTAIVLDLGTA